MTNLHCGVGIINVDAKLHSAADCEAASSKPHITLQSCLHLAASSGTPPVIIVAAETRIDLLFYEEYAPPTACHITMPYRRNNNSFRMFLEPLQSMCRVYTPSCIALNHAACTCAVMLLMA